ncbi:MAG: hypothetical protein MJE63_16080 [Proteobacteria bacterium]|nr:hypothetical protein [Pseudomonadota bacterium]
MLKTSRIRHLLCICLLPFLSACENLGHHEGRYTTGIDYPQKNIQLIVPFGKGSSSDQFASHFAGILSGELPVKVRPINVEGAGGLLGMLAAARKAPDGYTILQITPSHIISDVLNRSEIRLRETFDPLALIQRDFYLLLRGTKKAGPSIHTILSRENDTYTLGGISPKGLDEMTTHALSKALKVKLKFVPYASGHELRAAAYSGEVDFILGKMIANLKHIRSGILKAELLLNRRRLPQIKIMAGVPASGELGIDVDIQSWRGFAIRKGVPKHIRDYLVERIRYVYYGERYQVYLAQHLGSSYEDFIGPTAFASFWEEEYDAFSDLWQE